MAVGFGIRTPEQAAEIARIADAAVVGTALVEAVAAGAESGRAAEQVLQLVSDLAEGVRGARN